MSVTVQAQPDGLAPGSEEFARLTNPFRDGQPAVASYLRGPDGAHHAHAVQVLTFTASRVARIVSFNDPALLTTFGLPQTLPAAPTSEHLARRATRGSPSS